MYLWFVARRLGVLAAIVWAAATLNFLLPQIAPKNPVAEKLTQLAASSGVDAARIKELSEAYSLKFGLDEPLPLRYLHYLGDVMRFDFGPSIVAYPAQVRDLVLTALPWTMGLMLTATLIAFVLGTLLGALAAWRRDRLLMQGLTSLFMVLSAIPFYLVGLVLIYVFGAVLGWFPVSGGYSLFTIPSPTWAFAQEVLYHSVLPAASIVVASIGTWAVSMRAMMVTVQGEDYMTFALAKGLSPRRRLFSYALRNAMAPQITTLALSLGQIATGAVLVEVVFNYPGMGTLLLESATMFDYPTLYGIVFTLIVGVALTMLAVDLIYPLFDARLRAGTGS